MRYWKRHVPGKWFRQVKFSGRINQEKAVLLLDTGAEVSILDTTFTLRDGIGDNVYTMEGRTRIEITLAGYLIYQDRNAILGMDFMVPVGVRMDLADGSMCLPDEVGIPLNGRKRLYGEMVRSVTLERNLRIPVGQSEEAAASIKLSATKKPWVIRGERWVATVAEGPGRIRYLVISNIGEKIIRLDQRLDVGMILNQDKVLLSPGFASVASRRYWEWQNIALESTIDTRSEPLEATEGPEEPLVQRPTYPTPRSILRRPKPPTSTEIAR
ncbi:hypothetical protein PHMEG_00019612 [Phytophthora megakarya]|uniref:Peptidase A2 domain-containing protein n=1 Tax=Phytophthora megakarya TaxID=4795 RepID=A0A225VR67_9STRA|nr:hypothetical protein PHMEG_00019612 [Phytophthora megakarya]